MKIILFLKLKKIEIISSWRNTTQMSTSQNVFQWQHFNKMSKPQFDSDGFQIVTSKRSKNKKSTKVPQDKIDFQKEDLKINIAKSYRSIQAAEQEIRTSEYLQNVVNAVSNVLKHRIITEIVCFGLGHIGDCQISKYQLALLLCLKNQFKPKKVIVHDPIFYADECEILKQFKLDIIEKNTEGNYVISDQDITLVYLPHCPKQLTNNFVWSNWSINLQKCILICNSFASLIENHPSRLLKETVPYIQKIYPYTTESILDNNFIYKDIFNDTSLHYFLSENLKDVPIEFWSKESKPEYKNTEEFITTLMIEKLNIGK